MSLFTSFNVGVSGIRASQAGLNTTAHNLSNTKTQGYTRQQNILTDTYYQNYRYTDKSTLQIGLGTTVAEVRQIRDMFLDREYRLEVSRENFYQVQYDAVTEIEDVLGEMEGVEFQFALQDMWSALQGFSMDMQDITKRELFISESVSFLARAQDVYNELYNYQVNLNAEIKSQVEQINSIAEQIAQLNLSIARAEAADLENANDLRDSRNLLMDQLAEITYYTYNEDATGKVDIYINSAPLVTGTHSYHMGVDRIKFYDEDGNVTTVSQLYDVHWLDNGYDQVYDLDRPYSYAQKTDTGTLLGILTARGKIRANYSDIPVKPDKEDEKYYENGVFDNQAYEIDLHQYEEELKVYNNTTSNSVLTEVEAQFDQLIHGIVMLLNDTFCPNIKQELTGVTGTDAKGNTVTLADGDYKVLDVLHCPVGSDDDGTIGTEVFSRKMVDRYQVLTLDDQIYGTDEEGNQIPLAQEIQNADGTTTYKLYVYNEEDPSDPDTLYTLMSLEINPDMISDYALLPVKFNPASGEEGYNSPMLNDLISKWYEDFTVLDPNSKTTYSYDEYYQAMITNLATRGHTWKSITDNQDKVVADLEQQRQQVMGVSSEEEMVNLLQFQHAYNAASRYITVIDSMLGYLIERLGA
ncbi:MAG: flagellar basal body rod C-terminal domain-containing protein [Eubacteriales bacterium]|nr:flagellar basal body rod C-terminal domain-containing protein [Eubacteriales bacterium]